MNSVKLAMAKPNVSYKCVCRLILLIEISNIKKCVENTFSYANLGKSFLAVDEMYYFLFMF